MVRSITGCLSTLEACMMLSGAMEAGPPGSLRDPKITPKCFQVRSSLSPAIDVNDIFNKRNFLSTSGREKKAAAIGYNFGWEHLGLF